MAAGDFAIRIILSIVDRTTDELNNLRGRFNGLAGGIRSLFAGLSAALALREFVEINKQFDAIKKGLEAVQGSEQLAASSLQHLSALAQRTGQDLGVLAQQYLSFAAASKGTALEGEQANAIFDAVASAMGRLGKSSTDTERAFVALGQMMSKGQVYAEEWRGQLSESLPLANAAVQKATGLTTQEFRAMMEAGNLLAVDVLPALAKGLTDLGMSGGEPVDTLTASMQRFNNTLKSIVTDVGQAGGNDILSGFFDNATASANALAKGTKEAWGATESVREAFSRGSQVVGQYLNPWGMLVDKVKEYGKAQQDSAPAISETTQRLQGVASAALKAASDYTTLYTAADKAEDVVKKQGQAAVTAAQANLELANLSGQSADILRAEAAAAEAAARASANNATEKTKLAALTQGRITQLQDEVAGLQSFEMAEGVATEEIGRSIEGKEKQIETEQKLLDKRQAEAAATQEVANKEAVLARAAKLTAETYGDQSNRIDEYREALERLAATSAKAKTASYQLDIAQQELADAQGRYAEAMTKAKEGSVEYAASIPALKKQLDEAQGRVDLLTRRVEAGAGADEKAAVLKGKLADALDDLVKRQELASSIAEETSTQIETENELRLGHIENIKAEYEARRWLVSASTLERQAREAEIKGLEDLLAARAAEALALEAELEAKLTLAALDGQVTAAEQAEIARANSAVVAKLQEIDAIKQKIAAKKLESETESWGYLQGIANRDAQATATENDAFWSDYYAKKAADAAEKTASWNKQMQGAAAIAKWMANEVAGAKKSIASYSQEAADAFSAVTAGVHGWQENIDNISKLNGADFVDSESTDDAVAKLAELNAGLEKTKETIKGYEDAAQRGGMFAKFYDEMAVIYEFQQEVIEAQIAEKKLEVAGEELAASMSDLADSFDEGAIGSADYLASLERLRAVYNNLSEEDLANLDEEIQDVKDSMAEQADEAVSSLEDWRAKLADIYGQEVQIQMLSWQQDRAEAEVALAEARKNGNAEEIAALQEKIALIDQYYQIQVKAAAEQQAQDAIDAADAAAEEAARRAGLTAEERQYEDTIASLKASLAAAIQSGDQVVANSIIDQIEAEKRRHEAVMANIEAEKKAKGDNSSASDAGADTGSQTSTASTTTSRTTTQAATSVTGGSYTMNVNIEGVLDVNDRTTLDALARKLRPYLAELERKGVS